MTETGYSNHAEHHREHHSLDAALSLELDDLRRRGLARRTPPAFLRVGAVLLTDGGKLVDFASNDYLGLASDERPAIAAMRALVEQGSGAAASRLIAGTNAEHDALERELADFFGAERALSFSSGYAANVGIIGALVGKGDVIFSDSLNHASLIDGARVSRASIHVYPHADAAALEQLLSTHRRAHRRALIVTDGLFSMDGDVAPLPALTDLASRYDAWTYVDDAHGVGATGPEGRGTAAALGVAADVDVLVGTLGKAFGAAGAFVLGSSTLHAYLINRARSFVFSTAPMPAQAAAAREGLRVVRAEPERLARLARNAVSLRATLASLGIHCPGEPASHIVPVMIGDAERTAAVGAALRDRGFAVGAIRPPTVPIGTSRLRISVSAAHTHEQIVDLAHAVADSLAPYPR